MTCIYYLVISFLISSVMVSINNNANEYCVTAEIGVLGTICNDMYPKDYFFLKVYCLPEKQTKSFLILLADCYLATSGEVESNCTQFRKNKTS